MHLVKSNNQSILTMPALIIQTAIICQFFCCVPIFAAPAAHSAKATESNEPTEPTYVLEQVSDTYGRVTTYINKRELKIKIKNSGAYLVASAPTWKVMFCNDSNKMAMTMTYEEWKNHLPQLTYSIGDYDRCLNNIARAGESKKLGRSVAHFIFPTEMKGNRLVPTGNIYHGDYFVIEPHWKELEAYSIMQKALSCPRVAAIPVELYNRTNNQQVVAFKSSLGGLEHWLTTKEIRIESLADSFFAYHGGYKACKREVEVMNDKSKKEDVDDVVRDLLPR